jgi:hypothetical protein
VRWPVGIVPFRRGKGIPPIIAITRL